MINILYEKALNILDKIHTSMVLDCFQKWGAKKFWQTVSTNFRRQAFFCRKFNYIVLGRRGGIKISGVCMKIFFIPLFLFVTFLKSSTSKMGFALAENLHSCGDKIVVLENQCSICRIQKNINFMPPKAATFCNRITRFDPKIIIQ